MSDKYSHANASWLSRWGVHQPEPTESEKEEMRKEKERVERALEDREKEGLIGGTE